MINGVWIIALFLIFFVIIIVGYIIYQRMNPPPLRPITPSGSPTGTTLQPVTGVSLLRGLTPGDNPLIPIGGGNTFVPIILPSNLPRIITDCAFYGNLIQASDAGPCPAGSDFVQAILPGQGPSGCYGRPCPSGYVRFDSCTCGRA
ncbi:Hypothetical protein POVR1_LOCUS364 [uncultured virus]|nr:Hypothetical protein POVR1_LOCUS364 [uncultured virus]